MRTFFLFFFILHPLFATEMDQIDDETEAFWEIDRFGEAEMLYQQLTSEKLPSWQQARLQYNLGTLKLAQNQPIEALRYLQTLLLSDLSLPKFGRDLLLNKAIAYSQYSQTLLPKSPFFDLQPIFLNESLKVLKQAEQLNCRLQQTEGKKECSIPLSIHRWIQKISEELENYHHQKVNNWLDQTSSSSLATFLSLSLQQLMNQITPQSEDISYYIDQTETLVPLWNALKVKKLSTNANDALSKSFDAFSKGIQRLKNKDFTGTIESFSIALDQLNALNFKEDIPLNLAHLSYETLLLQSSFSLSDLEILQWEIDQIEKYEAIKEVKKSLQSSQKSLKKNNLMEARFFLLEGFGWIDSLISIKEPSPLDILQRAFQQASRSYQLFLLSPFIKSLDNQKQLAFQQRMALEGGDRFIPAVLKEQKIQFSSSDSSCQQFPWDQAIPLFDHGYSAAKKSSALLEEASLDRESIGAQQEQTLQDWNQAIELLKHPSAKNQTYPDTPSSPKNLSETFQLIQEMYLEDQSQPQPEIGELHSW